MFDTNMLRAAPFRRPSGLSLDVAILPATQRGAPREKHMQRRIFL
jgi:hypothetical protein